jgi:hypothetical protein
MYNNFLVNKNNEGKYNKNKEPKPLTINLTKEHNSIRLLYSSFILYPNYLNSLK